jgi:uncharacterized protein
MFERQPAYRGPERRKSRRWRPRRVPFLVFCVVIVGVCYVAAAAWLMSQETLLVFQAGATLSAGRPDFPWVQIDLPRADGARQFAWEMKGEASEREPWILFLHGNAQTVASKVNISHYRQLRALGVNVFAAEYRGFGGLDGQPTQAALATDARVAYDYLRSTRHLPANRIVIYGWSLGAAVAVELAAEVDEAAVILEGAPASLVAIRQRRYPFFPIRLIMRNPFEAITLIDRIHAPILFLHSPDDDVIPIAEGRRLFEAARAPKTFVEVRGGHVYASEVDAEHFFGAIRPFLEERGLLDSHTAATTGR